MLRKKLLTILISSLITLPFFATSTKAYLVTERSMLKFDENLSDKTQRQYAFPDKILIYRIESSADQIDINTENWIDLLYYHFITRLGFADLPFNYFLDRQGNVYEGRENAEGVVPELDPVEGGLLIGYLSNSSDIPVPAAESLDGLIEDLSYKYGIERDSVMVIDLKISPKEAEGQLSKLSYEIAEGSVFASQSGSVLDKVKYSSEDHLDFVAEVSKVEFAQNVELGSSLQVKVTLQNTGTQPWFTYNDFIYLITADGEDSEFAVNGEWDAFDTPTHLEGETVLPGDSIDIQFNMNAYNLPGQYSETFVFSRLGNKRLSGTEFSVNFSITSGDKQLIEILSTETGSLNVRSAPRFNGEIIAQVDIGERFIVEGYDNGWYKIKYNGEDEGWISAQYAKVL